MAHSLQFGFARRENHIILPAPLPWQDRTIPLIRQAIREVQNGNLYFSSISGDFPEAAFSNSATHKNGIEKKPNQLTARETEVLQLIAEGKANKQTAVELGISSKTVEKHRHNLMTKLKIHDTASLTRHAIEIGLIETPVPVEAL